MRHRVAPFADRIWNPDNSNGYADFEVRVGSTDLVLDALLADQQPPGAPTNAGASDALYDDRVRVAWNAGGNYPIKFALYRNTVNDSGSATLIQDDIPKTVDQFEDSSVNPGQTYYYWVRAWNQWGWSVFSSAATGVTGSSSGLAEFYEPFDYAAGQSVAGQNGGEGFGSAWNLVASNGPVTIVADSLAYPGRVSQGGALRVECQTDLPTVDLQRSFSGNAGHDLSEVWFSFLVRAENVGDGHMFLSLNNGPPLGKSWVNGFGIHGGAEDQITAGNTHLVVAKYDCRPGADKVFCWIDPSVDAEPLIENVSCTFDQDDMGFGNNLSFNIQGYGQGTYLFDDLRLGSTWESALGVMPAGPVETTLIGPAVNDGSFESVDDDGSADRSADLLLGEDASAVVGSALTPGNSGVLGGVWSIENGGTNQSGGLRDQGTPRHASDGLIGVFQHATSGPTTVTTVSSILGTNGYAVVTEGDVFQFSFDHNCPQASGGSNSSAEMQLSFDGGSSFISIGTGTNTDGNRDAFQTTSGTYTATAANATAAASGGLLARLIVRDSGANARADNLNLSVTAAGSGASVSGEVWVDANSDGIKQSGEERVANAGVRLYHDKNGDGFCERIVQYVNSSASGTYAFSGITETGLYQVGIDPLSLPDDLYRLTERDQSGSESDDNDVDRDTFRTEFFQINSTDDSLTDLGDIGFLQGSGTVTYEGTATVSGEPTHYWKYQDLEFYLQDLGYDPVSASTLEIVTRWLKWYAIGERILQEAEVLPGYLEYQRFGGTAPDSVKRFNTVNGLGSFAAGAKFISSGIPPATLFNDMNDDPTEHNLMFYETTRGANPIWKYRGTWPHGGRLTHHGLAATIHWEILGPASINKVPALGGWTPVENTRIGLWESEGTTFPLAFPMVLQPGGGQPGLPDQFEHDNHYGNYGGIVGGSRDILAAILVTVMIDHGRDKVVEILQNLSTKSHYAPSIEQAMINFRDAVNDATDGAYATRLTSDWGFPAAASYADTRAIDSGAMPAGTTFLWDCKPHNYDPADIRSGYLHLSDRTTQGFGRFLDSNGTALRNLGAVDRLIPFGSTVQYPNERAYLVLGEGVDFVQQIPNGGYRVEMHTVDDAVANVSFPNDQVLAATATTFGVEVLDGELNIRADGITRIYEIVITRDDSINQPVLYFREEFDGYNTGSIVGQTGPSGDWVHSSVQGSFELGAGLSGDNGLVFDSSGSNDLEIILPSMLATRIWMSYLYNESSYGGHFYVSGVGHRWSNQFAIDNVGGSATYSVGQTYRVVALYDWDANTTSMWIDPDPNTEPVTDPDAPGYAPAVVYDGVVSNLGTLRISSYCDGTIDDIRLANNYASVVGDGSQPESGITTGAAGNIGQTSADVAYSVTDGGEPVVVTLYYGTSDGGNTPGSWDNSQSLGTKASGSHAGGLSGLSASTTYFFNFEATNSGGSVWGESGSFTTSSAPPQPGEGMLINVDWGKGPAVDGVGYGSGASVLHTGAGVVGSAGDVWNATDSEDNVFAALENLMESSGTATTVDVTWSDELQSSVNDGAIEFGSTGHNALMEDYSFTAPGDVATVTISSIEANAEYTLHLYGVPDGSTQQTIFEVTGANESAQTVVAGNTADDNGLANPDDYVVFTGNTGPSGQIVYTQTGGSTFSASNGFQLTVVGETSTSYDDWASANGASSDPNEDSNRNGIPNGIEFVLGGTNEEPITLPRVESDAGTYTWTLPYDPEAGATWSFQESDDLVGWNDYVEGDPEVEVLADPDRIRFSKTPSGPSPRIFFRFAVVPD
ncbi:MAG: SdrD B-like domain-containing protein [Verrucomicrobiota bacterium]